MVFKDPKEVQEKMRHYEAIKQSLDTDRNPEHSHRRHIKKSSMPDYKKLLFDYDTTKESLIPQMNYIGSQFMSEYYNDNKVHGKSMTDFNRESMRNLRWQDLELNENRFLQNPTELMP